MPLKVDRNRLGATARRYDYQRIVAMRRAGMTREQITQETGASASVIRNAMRQVGVIDKPDHSDGCPENRIRVPEIALAAEVIAQALRDLEGTVGAQRRPNRTQVSEREYMEAVRFLTAERGEWADARELYADMAGVCPDAVRDHALRVISTLRTPHRATARTSFAGMVPAETAGNRSVLAASSRIAASHRAPCPPGSCAPAGAFSGEP